MLRRYHSTAAWSALKNINNCPHSIMNMNYCTSQWTCPHCLQVFSERESLKKHLAPDKVSVIMLAIRLILAYHWQGLVMDLLRALRVPSCQQPQDSSEGHITSKEENYDNLDSIKWLLAPGHLKCPHANCQKAYGKQSHLVRHFKARMFLSVQDWWSSKYMGCG